MRAVQVKRWAAVATATAVVGVGALAGAAPAAATGVTATTISAVSLSDGQPYPAHELVAGSTSSLGTTYQHDDVVRVAGTSTSGASGTVANLTLRCYSVDTGPSAGYVFTTLVATIIPDASTGAWSVYADPAPIAGAPCRLHAVPTDFAAATGFASFPAFATPLAVTRVILGEAAYAGPNSLAGTSLTTLMNGSQALATDYDQGDFGGVAGLRLLDDPSTPGHSGSAAFGSVDWVPPAFAAAGSVPARAGYLIDGAPAFGSFDANEVAPSSPGVPSMSMAATMDPASGDLAVVESNDLVNCISSTGAVVTTSPVTGCASWRSAGVRMTRTHTWSQGGKMGMIRTSWASTDGAAHALDVQYSDNLDGATFKIPGATSFAPLTAGQNLNPSTWPAAATLYTSVPADPTTATAASPIGAATFSSRPTAVVVAAVTATTATVRTNYARNIGAGSSITLTRTFSVAPSTAEAQADAATIAAGNLPSLVVDPQPTRVGTRAVTVTGHFVAGGNGVPHTASVNGTVGPVGADGKFAVNVVLPAGVGTKAIAVMGSDDDGQVASGAATTTYANPVTAGTPKVAKSKSRTGAVTKETVTVPVACASFGPATCKVTLKLGAKGKPLAASKTVTIAKGSTVKVVLALSAAARAKINALAIGKHLSGNLQVIYTDPAGGTLALPVRTVRLA